MNAALLKRLVPTDAVGKTGPIGVDFGTERLNLVQITKRGGSRIVNAATSLPYDNDRSAIVSAPRALRSRPIFRKRAMWFRTIFVRP